MIKNVVLDIDANTLAICSRVSDELWIIDAADYDLIAGSTWSPSELGYAQAKINGRHMRMHRLLMHAQPGQICDHIDGNVYNNSRSNLRFVTVQENCHNQIHAKGIIEVRPGCWKAYITVNTITLYLGYFRSKSQARRKYLEAKKKYHPSAPHHLYA